MANPHPVTAWSKDEALAMAAKSLAVRKRRRAESAARTEQYQKTVMSMAEDADRNGNAFRAETEVTQIGEPNQILSCKLVAW